MAIFEEVESAYREAVRARDRAQVSALRNVRAALQTETKKTGASRLDDETCLAVLRRLEKRHGESIEAFERAGRTERAEAERAELAVLERFLPRRADEATTRAWVEEAARETGAQGPRDVGRVMGAVMKAHKDEVDGALARRLAAEVLAERSGE